MISHPPSIIEPPCSVYKFCGGPLSCTAINCIVLFLNWVLLGQSCQYILVYNFTNMHAMTHRFDVFDSSSRVHIQEPTLCNTITLLWAVCQVRLRSFLMPTAMLDNQSSHNVFWLLSWVTGLYKSSPMLAGLRWIYAWNIILVRTILIIHLRAHDNWTAQLRRPVALISNVSLVIKFFTIQQ
jgi:hypothetical protein